LTVLSTSTSQSIHDTSSGIGGRSFDSYIFCISGITTFVNKLNGCQKKVMHSLDGTHGPDTGITCSTNLNLSLGQLLFQANRIVPVALLRRNMQYFIADKHFAIVFVANVQSGQKVFGSQ